MKPLRIYVSGPLSSDTDEGMFENCQRAVDVGIQLMQKGHYAIVPHLSLWTNIRAEVKHGVTFDWDWWMKLDLDLLECCEALFFIAPSRGADIEHARAEELGLQIFYSLDEVPEVGEAA